MRTKIFNIFYTCLIILFIISWLKVKNLPTRSEITPDLLQVPIQSTTTRANFSFPYKGKNYNVKPIFNYELWGLVVTQNNIGAWYNYYHDKNSVNLKDVCVVWGKNIEGGSYNDKNISYTSGEWTCYVNLTGQFQGTFYSDSLSNNHLLTVNEKIQKLVRSVNVGDQIYLKGSLVDYAEEGQSSYRMTSISRDDGNKDSRSGGACEIFYVDEMKILQKNQVFWHNINNLSKNLFIALIVLQLLLFIRDYNLFLKKRSL